jgi:hypothetical protein
VGKNYVEQARALLKEIWHNSSMPVIPDIGAGESWRAVGQLPRQSNHGISHSATQPID